MSIKNKIIVTGGAGFIGAHLTRSLCKEGFEVYVVDNLVNGKKELVDKKATLHIVDIADFKKLEEVFKKIKPNFVFHLACLPRVQYSIDFPRETNETNITGAMNVFLAAKNIGVKRVIYSASSSAYGDQKTMPLEETMKPNPKSPYGLQKYVGELYAKVFPLVYDIEMVSLRYFNVYGPDQPAEGGYAQAIPRFINWKKRGEPLQITGDGEQRRDCTHVYDVVAANIAAMKSKNVGKGEVINIGSGTNFSMNEIATIIGGKIKYIPARLEPRETLADITLAKKLLNWTPKMNLKDGIKELKKLNGIK